IAGSPDAKSPQLVGSQLQPISEKELMSFDLPWTPFWKADMAFQFSVRYSPASETSPRAPSALSCKGGGLPTYRKVERRDALHSEQPETGTWMSCRNSVRRLPALVGARLNRHRIRPPVA